MEKLFLRKLLFSILATLVFVGGVRIFWHTDKSILLNKLNVVPKREHYTELYFNNHLALPRHVAEDGSIFFSFSLHSLEGKDMKYPYSVYFVSTDGATTTIDNNMLQLDDGEYKRVEKKYSTPKLAKTGMVFVELLGRNQKIDFRIGD